MRYIRPVVAVAVALIATTLTSDRVARAQTVTDDLRAAAARYLETVLVVPAEVPNYKRLSAGPLTDAGSSALAIRETTYNADPFVAPRVEQFRIWGYVFPDVDGARAMVAGIRDNRTYTEPTGATVSVRWDGSVTGADQGESYRFTRRYPDGSADVGTGVAWRRGVVAFRISAMTAPRHETMPETLRLASVQNVKVTNIGPWVAPAPTPANPAPPAESPAPSAPMPAMMLLVAAESGGAIVRDGTTVQALVGGKACGEGRIIYGWTFLDIASRDTTPGCGVPGATVTFTIDGRPANETQIWDNDSFARGLLLTASSDTLITGLFVRPVVDVECRPAPGMATCSALDRRLWDGDLTTWLDRFAANGTQPTAENLLLAWAQFRAEREEVLGQMVAAVLQGRPFSFISAVRSEPSDDTGARYVDIITVGADRPAGGWQVRTADDGVYEFPADATLSKGQCRVYLGDDAGNVAASAGSGPCAGAVLLGGSLAHPGAVYLLDSAGEVIDSLGF